MGVHQQLIATTLALSEAPAAQGQIRERDRGLAHLASILQVIEEEIVATKGQVSAPSTGSRVIPIEETPSHGTLAQQMAQMVFVLEMLQLKVVECGQEKSSLGALISQAQVTLAKANETKIEQELSRISSEGIFGKIFGWVSAILLSVTAIVVGQPELLMMGLMGVASASGLTSKVTDALGDALGEIPGVSQDLAKALGGLLVVAAVVVATLIVSPAEAVQTTLSTGEEEIEMEGVSALSEEMEEVASGGEGGSKSRVYNPFRALSNRANLVIMNLLQAVSQTNIAGNITGAIAADTHMSDAEKAKIEGIVSIVVGLVAGLVSLGSGMAVASNTIEATAEGEASLSRIGKLIEGLGGSTSKIMVLMEMVRKGAMVADVGMTLGSGIVSGLQGQSEMSLEGAKADFGLLQESMQLNINQMMTDARQQTMEMRQQHIGVQMQSKLAAGEAAFASLFAHSPV